MRVVQSENYSYCVKYLMNYSQSGDVVFSMLLCDCLQSEGVAFIVMLLSFHCDTPCIICCYVVK